MKPAFDLSSVRKTLKNGIEKGLWTLEDLDVPSGGSLITKGMRVKEGRLEWFDYRTPNGNSRSVPKDKTHLHRNLLRG